MSVARFGHLAAVVTTVALTLTLAAPAQAAGRYTVRWGDTLTWIAQDHGLSLGRLARANHLQPYAVLVTGTVLRVPGGRAHSPASPAATAPAAGGRHGHGGHRISVRWGDTLTAIAARYGTTITRLSRMNGIDPAGVLLAGASLRVPGRAAATHDATPASGSEPAGWTVQGSIDLWAAHYGVDRHLARAIAWQESGYHTGVVSAVGAWGVMQVMPDTWRFVEGLIGHSVPRTPDGNIRIGVAYLHHLLNEFGGNERLAVAAYYQGPAGVRSIGLLPVSELYVANVLALRTRL